MDSFVGEGDDEAASGNLNRPSPENFDLFLPWACQQLQLDVQLIIINILSKFVDTKTTKLGLGKNRQQKKSKSEIFSDQGSMKSVSLHKTPIVHNEKVIKIYTVYDNVGNLIQLKFDKNKNIPRQVLRIVGLIIHFHIYLSNITINRGLNKGCLHELNIMMSHANITDVCLDNTFIHNSGYEILCEKTNHLRHLSISRCQIDDDAVKKIASKLVHPYPATHTLSLLNLASNSVTDAGAKHLAVALRSNRMLTYLNLSDNKITDDGAGAILDALKDFPISDEEHQESRSRTFRYLREKNELINKLMIELKLSDSDKKTLKKKGAKSVPLANSVGTTFPSRKDKDEIDDFDTYLHEKAEFMAESKLGLFVEPFSPENMETKNALLYCKGNNRLSYLNLSYNNLAYLSLKKILSVLKDQKLRNRKPRGLVKICIEGNCVPSSSPELNQIDFILASYYSAPAKKMSVATNVLSLRGNKM